MTASFVFGRPFTLQARTYSLDVPHTAHRCECWLHHEKGPACSPASPHGCPVVPTPPSHARASFPPNVVAAYSSPSAPGGLCVIQRAERSNGNDDDDTA